MVVSGTPGNVAGGCGFHLLWLWHGKRAPRGESRYGSSRPASASNSDRLTRHGGTRPNAALSLLLLLGPPSDLVTHREYTMDSAGYGDGSKGSDPLRTARSRPPIDEYESRHGPVTPDEVRAAHEPWQPRRRRRAA